MVAPDWRDISRRVEGMALASLLATKARVGDGSTAIERATNRLRTGLPDATRYSERVAGLVRHAGALLGASLSRRSERANACALQLRSLDPNATLSRGYAVVQLRDGKQAITSVQQVHGKDRLDVHVKDGKFPAEVARQYGF
jgi:exonuclease VII large subunit